jgi:hypothetical protein
MDPLTLSLIVGGGSAILNAVRGGIQSGQSKKMMGQMWKEDAKIPLYDPMQQSMLGRLQRQERQMRMGTDPSTALAMRNVGQVAAQTQANLARAGGPGLVQNLLSSQRRAGADYGNVAANAFTAANQLINPQLALVGDMARRAYDRQRYRRNVLFAQAQQKKADASASMEAAMGSLAMIGSFGGGGEKKVTGANSLLPKDYKFGDLSKAPSGFGLNVPVPESITQPVGE